MKKHDFFLQNINLFLTKIYCIVYNFI